MKQTFNPSLIINVEIGRIFSGTALFFKGNRILFPMKGLRNGKYCRGAGCKWQKVVHPKVADPSAWP
jgi:hypothetical protein